MLNVIIISEITKLGIGIVNTHINFLNTDFDIQKILNFKIIIQVRAFSDLSRTTANGNDCCGNVDLTLEGSDATASGTNTVEGRNLDFINNFVAVNAPNCS